MSPEDNKAIVRRLWDELFNRQNFAVVEEVASSDFVHHGPGPRVLRGAEFFTQLKSRSIFLAFPDLQFTTEELMAEGDKVVTRWTIRGTSGASLWAGHRRASRSPGAASPLRGWWRGKRSKIGWNKTPSA